MVVLLKPLTKAAAELWGHVLLSLNSELWENWTMENLLAERPGKWDLSWMVCVDGDPSGYAIVSRATQGVHLHHIVVATGLRSKGIGRTLLEKIAHDTALQGLEKVTLKVHRTNYGAIRLYLRIGFQITYTGHPELYQMTARALDIVNGVSTS